MTETKRAVPTGPAAGEAMRERFALSVARERWPDLVSFDHAVLPAPIAFLLEGDEFVVVRRAPPRRRIREGRIPRRHAPSIFLQAAAISTALQAASAWVDPDDLLDAGWDLGSEGGAGPPCARLFLVRSPASVSRGGLPVAPSDALLPLLDRLERCSPSGPGEALRALLAGPDASRRRADFWVASAYRLYPVDGASSSAAAAARRRTAGSLGLAWRSAEERARIEHGRALLAGRACRVFSLPPGSTGWTPGEALGLVAPGVPLSLPDAIALLRSRVSGSEGGNARPLWICVGRDRWDCLSRQAVAAVAVSRSGAERGGEGIELLDMPDAAPPPTTPDGWRRELLVPCGTVRATLRFCERLTELCGRDGRESGAVRERGIAMVADPAWPAYVADPTGDGALPPAPDPEDSRKRRKRRRPASVAPAPDGSPESRIAAALDGGDPRAALDLARDWRTREPDSPPQRWFELSARLAAACPPPLPAWLELLQAEREVSGGRAADACDALERVVASESAAVSERRAASLRLAELAVEAGRWNRAATATDAWLSAYFDAPVGERVRALRIRAAAASRSGDAPGALALVDAAQSLLAAPTPGPTSVRFELLLLRAAVLSRAGRFDEEREVYAGVRSFLASVPADDRLAARLLAAEALGLSDRRDFDAAVARLEEARAILRDDPVESARVAIDLAAALYHAGRRERCKPLLEEAAALAAAAGREDLARLALGNRVEAALGSEDWSAAEEGVEALAASARRDQDATWTLVALHARGRLALRRGRLDAASRDNAEALDLAARLEDRLEAGELRLEAGDLAALRGDGAAARRAWEEAERDPPDRCDTDVRARERLAELEALESGSDEGVAEMTRAAAERILRGEFEAAESVARWSALRRDRISGSLIEAAADLLRRRGAAALAEIACPSRSAGEPAGASGLRALRDAVVDALAGGEPPSALPLGLAAVALSRVPGPGNDVGGSGGGGGGGGDEDEVRIGEPYGEPATRALRVAAESWRLRLWPASAGSDADFDAAALVVETLLFRRLLPGRSSSPASFPQTGFVDGWRRFGVVTADPAMEEPYRRLERFAPKTMTVLVLGDSGSGKEAVARAVHALSPRAAGPFVAVNVSAIPSALVESELFGHARGAFTGADRDRAGLLEEAGRGTIFFDEIGDLAAALQSKLLRALQDREIRRVGENRARRIDVRVVSATSRDLAREVEAGRFREDLYYRLHVAVIRLPRLAERGRDAILLARHFLEAAAREDGRGPFDLAPDAASALLAHSWPGNVRELQSAMASAAALADGGRIDARLLPEVVRRAARPAGREGGYRSSVDAHRRDLIMEALERAGGNRSRAARDLRLSRQALLYLIRELRVPERRAR